MTLCCCPCHLGITEELLHELFEYDPKRGCLLRRKATFRHPKGSVASVNSGDGYTFVTVKRVQYREHRAIWMMHNGPIPPRMVVDHIDRNRSNNRIENLRLATYAENQTNRKLNKNNTSGHAGVAWYEPYKKWRARISPGGRNITLGYYSTQNEAVAARKAAEHKFGYLSA